MEQLLKELDIQFDNVTAEEFSRHFHETLYSNVVSRISKALNAEQMEELSALRKQDKNLAWEWIKVNIPDLKSIIQEEIYMLIGDVAENADHL